MDHWIALIILAIVQGATEFLPVSSSGHLSIGHALFSFEEGAALLDVVLHVGTLGAVVVVYRDTLKDILRESIAGLKELPSNGWKDTFKKWPGFKLAMLIAAGSIPTGVIGLLLKNWVEGSLRSPTSVGTMLLLTGGILWSTRKSNLSRSSKSPSIKQDTKKADNQSSTHSLFNNIQGLGFKEALIIGVLQGLAVIPGISRSGTTIAGALWLKVEGSEAARFSFLLSIPAILGALLLKLKDTQAEGSISTEHLFVGALCAAGVGYFCLRWLVKLLRKAQFHHFAWYCWGAGIGAIYLGMK